jgi:hypothetical protein
VSRYCLPSKFSAPAIAPARTRDGSDAGEDPPRFRMTLVPFVPLVTFRVIRDSAPVPGSPAVIFVNFAPDSGRGSRQSSTSSTSTNALRWTPDLDPASICSARPFDSPHAPVASREPTSSS